MPFAMNANRIVCRLCLLVALLCGTIPAEAQNAPSTYQTTPVAISRIVDTVLGKPYRVHTVLKGHTLYSICKAYGVEADEILKDSPRGQVQADEFLYIPLNERLADDPKSFEKFEGKRPWAVVFLEKERSGDNDTRRKNEYAADMSDENEEPDRQKSRRDRREERIAARAEAKADLKDKEAASQEENEAFAEEAELPLPVASPLQAKEPKDTLRISLLLPLYSSTPESRRAYIYLPFFEGASVAWLDYTEPDFFNFRPDTVFADTAAGLLPTDPDEIPIVQTIPTPREDLRQPAREFRTVQTIPTGEGPFLQLKLFDLTESDSSLRTLSADPYFRQCDAILAAAFIDQFEFLDSVANLYEIPLIHPLSERDSMAPDNPRFVQLAANYSVQLERVSRFIAARYTDARILVLSDSSSSEIRKADRMHALLPGSERILFNAETAQMLEELAETEENVVIVPFYRNEITAVKTVLPLRQTKGHITILAPALWLDYATIDLDYFIHNHLTVYSTFPCLTRNPEFDEFSKKYYFLYHGLPNMLAYQGYQALSWLTAMLSVHNADFLRHLSDPTENDTPLLYNLQERGHGLQGFENRYIQFMELKKNGLEKLFFSETDTE